MSPKSTGNYKNLAVGFAIIAAAGSAYAFLTELLPLLVVIAMAMAVLWFTVKYGSAKIALSLRDHPMGHPIVIAALVGVGLFLLTMWLKFSMVGASIGQTMSHTLPEQTSFVQYLLMRIEGGYGSMGSRESTTGWVTIAVWTAWTGIVSLAALRGARIGRGPSSS